RVLEDDRSARESEYTTEPASQQGEHGDPFRRGSEPARSSRRASSRGAKLAQHDRERVEDRARDGREHRIGPLALEVIERVQALVRARQRVGECAPDAGGRALEHFTGAYELRPELVEIGVGPAPIARRGERFVDRAQDLDRAYARGLLADGAP